MSKRRRGQRYDAPPKEQLRASIDEMIAQRLREMRLPEPPPAFRERSRRAYADWLDGRGGRNSWRD